MYGGAWNKRCHASHTAQSFHPHLLEPSPFMLFLKQKWGVKNEWHKDRKVQETLKERRARRKEGILLLSLAP